MANEQPGQMDLCEAEAHVQRILVSRRNANASGQNGEDVENIRTAFFESAATAVRQKDGGMSHG